MKKYCRRDCYPFATGAIASDQPRYRAMDPLEPRLLLSAVAFSTPNLISIEVDGARAVFAADLDRDGDTDVLSASLSDNRIAWYENKGDQDFTPHTITTAANGARSVFVSDVDSDGDMDVLSASSGDHKIAWYENDGDQNFTSHTISTAAMLAYMVTASDLDGDGDIDVLSASSDDDKIAWYENDGSQNFTARTITTTANAARAVFASDVDGDGDMDVLSASFVDSTIAWYENNGSNNFVPHTIATDAPGARSVYATDIDGDGDMDVLSASRMDDKIAWYENNGTQNFTAHTITLDAGFAVSAFASDVDGDGDMDVLSSSFRDDKIAWYENDGQGNFTAHTITVVANGASSVFAFDVDGDGDMDVLSASADDDKIAWYENQTLHASAKFPEPSVVDTTADGPVSVLGSDLDRDGDVDLLVASPEDNKIFWYENNGSQSFSEHTISTAVDGATSVLALDVDRDGDTDVLSASTDGNGVSWFENDGDQNFLPHTVTTLLDGATSVLGADMDRDGDIDLLSSSADNDTIVWYENDGSQAFTPHTVTTSADGVQAVMASDLDADGDVDVLSASANDDTIAWYENDGSQVYTRRVITTFADGARAVFVLDVDRDGDLDVLSASANDNTISWYENDGQQAFVPHIITTAASSVASVYASDVDADGDIDVVGALAEDDAVVWYENDGSQNFAPHTITTSADGASAVFVVDLDRDGDADVISASSLDDKLAWYENTGGQFELATADTAPLSLRPGQKDDLLSIVARHQGRADDGDVALATLDLLFEASAGVALTQVQAAALIQSVQIYLDDGSGQFNSDVDTLVSSIENLSLTTEGVQTVEFSDNDPNTNISFSLPKTYFVVVELTQTAFEASIDQFRVSHLTESTSTAQDAEHGIGLTLAFGPNVSSSSVQVTPLVIGRHIFYNNSSLDGHSAVANEADDNAISDKLPLMPNDTATFSNYTSYNKGINGIMIDVLNLKSSSLSMTEFVFRMGNNDDPTTWDFAPGPSIDVRPPLMAGDPSRITLIWDDHDIKNQWLQVTVLANENTTGLAGDDVFYFGNAIGETGDNQGDLANAMVDLSDVLGVRGNVSLSTTLVGVQNEFDFNRDNRVNVIDMIIARDSGADVPLSLISVSTETSANSPSQVAVALNLEPAIALTPIARLNGFEMKPGRDSTLLSQHVDRFNGSMYRWRLADMQDDRFNQPNSYGRSASHRFWLTKLLQDNSQ